MRTRTETLGVARVSGNAPALLTESRHELWNLNPMGDLEGCYFDLPTPVKLEHIQKAAVTTWNLWFEWKSASQHTPIYREGQFLGMGEDSQPTEEPRIRGPFTVPEYDRLDLARYYMTCRWKRRSPKLISLDEAIQYAEMGEAPDDEEMFSEFFKNLRGVGSDPNLEREARKHAKELPEQAKREEEYHKQLAWRLANLKGN